MASLGEIVLWKNLWNTSICLWALWFYHHCKIPISYQIWSLAFGKEISMCNQVVEKALLLRSTWQRTRGDFLICVGTAIYLPSSQSHFSQSFSLSLMFPFMWNHVSVQSARNITVGSKPMICKKELIIGNCFSRIWLLMLVDSSYKEYY